MNNEKVCLLKDAAETAFLDYTFTSNVAYRPQFVSNDYRKGKKVLSSVWRLLQWVGLRRCCRH